jgi:hypothetical protein
MVVLQCHTVKIYIYISTKDVVYYHEFKSIFNEMGNFPTKIIAGGLSPYNMDLAVK